MADPLTRLPPVDPARRAELDKRSRLPEPGPGRGPGTLRPTPEPGAPTSVPRTVRAPARSPAVPAAPPERDASDRGLQQGAAEQMRRALGVVQGAPSQQELARAIVWLGADTPAGCRMQAVYDSYQCLRRGRSGWISA